MELHNRFNKMLDETKKFHEYLHVFVSHGLTLIIGLAGYGFAKHYLMKIKIQQGDYTVFILRFQQDRSMLIMKNKLNIYFRPGMIYFLVILYFA